MRTYLCIGESTTSGYPTVSGYRGKVHRVVGHEWEAVGPFVDAAGLRHAGFPGQTSDAILSHVPQLLGFRPDLVIVSAGLNDLPYKAPYEVSRNVRAISDAFAGQGADVRPLLLTDADGVTAQVSAYNRAILDACGRAYPVVPAGPAAGPAGKGRAAFADEGHPSQLGYDRMADAILRDVFGVDAATIAASRPSAATGALTNESLFRLANDALRTADPAVPAPVRQIALAIGFFESGFGQSGSWAPEGVPSNNWGALTYTGKNAPGWFVHGDTDASGEPIKGGVKFGKWPTLSEGYVGFYQTWAKSDTWAAAVRGDAFAVALAMYRHRYFVCGVPPASCKSATEWDHAAGYAKAIMTNATAAAKALGEPLAVRLDIPPREVESASSKGDFVRNVAVLGVVSGIFYATLKMKAPKPAMVR